MRIGIVAGENSGDLLGAGLMAALQKRFPDAIFEGIGGERMLALGFNSFFPLDRLAVMGLVEPLKRLPELLRIRGFLKKHFVNSPPDIFIGIDAPDFNLSLELYLKKAGIKTAHYVSPSVWAWRRGRIKKIKKCVDLMLTLFPHEEAFYQEHGVPVACVGHSLADQIPLDPDVPSAQARLGLEDSAAPYIALLPGSRSAEVRSLWPLFLQAANLIYKENASVKFLVPAANSARKKEIQEALANYSELPITVFDGQSHDVMLASDLVLMASGTTTLEAMLLKKPMVISYKLSWFSYAILSRLVKVDYIGLPNLLANRSLVPEFIQDQATPENLCKAMLEYLRRPEAAIKLREDFLDIHLLIKRNASEAAADALQKLMSA